MARRLSYLERGRRTARKFAATLQSDTPDEEYGPFRFREAALSGLIAGSVEWGRHTLDDAALLYARPKKGEWLAVAVLTRPGDPPNPRPAFYFDGTVVDEGGSTDITLYDYVSIAPDRMAHLAELGKVLDAVHAGSATSNWFKERDYIEAALERHAILQTHSGTTGRRRVLQRKMDRHHSAGGDLFHRAYQGGLPGLGKRR